MQLEELVIDGLASGRRIQLSPFSPELTFVYGESSTGKSLAGRLVQQLLFDDEREIRGHLTFRNHGQRYVVSRTQAGQSAHFRAWTNDPVGACELGAYSLIGNLDRATYDTIFHFSFRQTGKLVRQMARVLVENLHVPSGWRQASDQDSRLAVLRQRDGLQAAQTDIENRVAQLEKQRLNLLARRDIDGVEQQDRIKRLNSHIGSVQDRIAQRDREWLRDQLRQLDGEIAELQSRLDKPSVTSRDPEGGAARKYFETLYHRLDDIDVQIRRWRHLQTEVQSQRLRLRDQMLQWNELTLESEQHPYFQAREILVGLETKVDLAERNARHWASAGGARVDTDQIAKTLGQICQSMREDLHGLCAEMDNQYKHLRHKGAAEELKHLRHCYTEMGDNIDRLVHRRSLVLREIRRVDPVGAEAVMRADVEFIQCAHEEGFLEARLRLVDGPGAPASISADVDTAAEQKRLLDLQRQRENLVDRIDDWEREVSADRQLLADLKREREALGTISPATDWAAVAAIDAELQKLSDEADEIRARLLTQRESPTSTVILNQAGNWLRQVTEGELHRVAVVESPGGGWAIEVGDRHDSVVAFEQLETDRQDQVYLCLALAARSYLLSSRRLQLPMLIDDAFCRIAGDRIMPTLQLLSEFCHQGHQVVLFTQHRYLADWMPGVPVLELTPATSELALDESTVAPKVIRLSDTRWASENRFDDVTFEGIPPRPYPLSKYAREESPIMANQPRLYPVGSSELGPGLKPDNWHEQSICQHSLADRSDYAPVPVESIADPVPRFPTVDETMALDRLPMFENSQLRKFVELGIDTVGDLLRLDVEGIEFLGVSRDLVTDWQSQLWLLTLVPGLRMRDSRQLVSCGITEPLQIVTSDRHQLWERLNRLVDAPRFQHGSIMDGRPIELARIDAWQSGLDATRSRWQGRKRPGSDGRQRPSAVADHHRWSQGAAVKTKTRALRGATVASDPNFQARQPVVVRPPRMHSEPVADTRPAPLPEVAEESRPPLSSGIRLRTGKATSAARSKPAAQRHSGKPNAPISKLKFHLDLQDHIEAAPAIGPKTAERFEKIGVSTVADFLKPTAESIAEKLNYKRMSANVVRQWQQQARLVCRVPNLRGHDAQLLVACKIIEPEDLASMSPEKLFQLIGPFSESKEGQKIIRNGKRPDLAEVTDWITWAAETRSLQAA